MSRYEIDKWLEQCTRYSFEEIEDAAYGAVKKLYYGYRKTVGDDLASDLLYTTAAIIILNSGTNSLSQKAYRLLSSAFGVRLSYDEFTRSLDKHNTESKREYLNRAINNLNNEEQDSFIIFASTIYACDGEITRGEREFIYSVLGA